MSEQETTPVVTPEQSPEQVPTSEPTSVPIPVVSRATNPVNELPSVDEMMNGGWKIFKERFWSLLFLNAIPLVTIFVVVGLLAVFYVKFPEFINGFSFGQMMSWSTIIGIVVPILIAGVIIVFTSLWCNLALLREATAPVRIPLKQAFGETRSKIASALWLGILMSIIVGGSAVFFVIPSVIFSVFFFFSAFVLVVQGETGMRALLKSREYIRGYWLRTFGYILLFVVITVIANVILKGLEDLFNPLSVLLGMAFQLVFPAFVVSAMAYLFGRYQQLKPNVVVNVTKKDYLIYFGVGILGILLVLGFVVGTVFFFKAHPEVLMYLYLQSNIK